MNKNEGKVKKVKVTLHTPDGVTQKCFSSSVTVSEALEEMGKTIPKECGGKGNCGKCAVRAEGILSPRTEREKELFASDMSLRLACTTRIYGDTHLFYNTTQNDCQVESDFTYDPSDLSPFFDGSVGSVIDVGTTTVACAVFDLESGKLLRKKTAVNPQYIYGSDVMTRLEYASEHGGAALSDAINTLVDGFAEGETVITGNTVMLSFLSRSDTNGMTAYPFTPPSLFGVTEGERHYCRCVSSFFGADALCALSVCPTDEPFLMADIGTNGEIALFDGEKYYVSSTSAGPCFEGCGITSGVPAVSGAVYKVWNDGRGVNYSTFGSLPPVGICGSGLCDLVSCLLNNGYIEKNGNMRQLFRLSEKVTLTESDVRKLQLAKAAIRGGIETLLDVGGMRGKVKKMYLAGGFGSSLDPSSAENVGLIPRLETIKLGNAALAGAANLLLKRGNKEKLDKIAEKCVTVTLGGNDGFSSHFINQMNFGGN